MPDRKKIFRLAHSSVRAWWENWAKERMGGGGKEKRKNIPKMDGRSEKKHFACNSTHWDAQILKEKKKLEGSWGEGKWLGREYTKMKN